MMADLLRVGELPDKFSYPPEFLRMVGRGLLYFEPWYVYEGEQLRTRYAGLRERYPTRNLVPFARRQDNDDVACFDLDRGGVPVVVHDFATPGWEQRAHLQDFYAWLRMAVDDMIEWDSL